MMKLVGECRNEGLVQKTAENCRALQSLSVTLCALGAWREKELMEER